MAKIKSICIECTSCSDFIYIEGQYVKSVFVPSKSIPLCECGNDTFEQKKSNGDVANTFYATNPLQTICRD
jgi:hypothetical protein